MIQAEWIPNTLGLGLRPALHWIIALAVGLAVGALIGGLQGFIVAYVGVPSFIVTLGGLLVWRGVAFQLSQARRSPRSTATSRSWAAGPRARSARR